MTGFGTGQASDGVRAFVFELRSVNHKFCDVRTRLPREYALLEGRLQGLVRGQISRGRVDVSLEVSFLEGASFLPRLNLALAKGYKDALEKLRDHVGLQDAVELAMIAGAPGVLEGPTRDGSIETLLELLEPALNAGLKSLNVMREREGAALSAELRRLLASAEENIQAIVKEVPLANRLRKQRLEQRIRDLLEDKQMDGLRLAQEIALLADRSDITEETARIESHAVQFAKILSESEPVGRKLDFLLQEMHREANTIGSKASSAVISHLVVDLKSTLERMREQVQNVE